MMILIVMLRSSTLLLILYSSFHIAFDFWPFISHHSASSTIIGHPYNWWLSGNLQRLKSYLTCISPHLKLTLWVVQPRYQLSTMTIAIPLDCIVQTLAAKATEERLQKVIVLMQNSCIQGFPQPAPCQGYENSPKVDVFFLLTGGSLTWNYSYNSKTGQIKTFPPAKKKTEQTMTLAPFYVMVGLFWACKFHWN